MYLRTFVTDDEDDDVAQMLLAHETTSYDEATNDNDHEKWEVAMTEKIDGLHQHQTRELLQP